MTLLQRDKAIIWHPFTQEKTAKDVIVAAIAKGSYIYDESGKSYLDLISSWWVNIHGHAHEKIAKAIYEQANKLEHVIFSGFTHKPAIDLCERIGELLPNKLARFFFSDNGSTAVEVALKMACQYWYNQGQTQKNIFLSFSGGYHGDTFGAMSVGFKSGFHDVFSDLFFKVLSIPYPFVWDDDDDVNKKEKTALAVLDGHLKEHGNMIAALIIEPLIQGASGMRTCRSEFIDSVVERVRSHGILVIFDEVMTGFGRTGTTFAFMQTEVVPDFLCLSKGLSGGFLPLALTVTTNEVYSAFLANENKFAFAHGHSYTANPLACAAALASLDLLMEEKCRHAMIAINETHRSCILELRKKCRSTVAKTRVLGTVAAFEVRNGLIPPSQIKSQCLQEGLLLRPLGNTIYLLPPFSITPAELKDAYQKIANIIELSSSKLTTSHIP